MEIDYEKNSYSSIAFIDHVFITDQRIQPTVLWQDRA